MSIAGFDTLHPVHEAPQQANENVQALAMQGNTTEGQKLLMDANLKMLNTAHAHLPVGFSIEEHTTAAGLDVKTLTGKDGKVLATDSKDQDGREFSETFLYDQKTGKEIVDRLSDDMGTKTKHFDGQTGELKDSVHNNYDGTVDARVYNKDGQLVSEINKDRNDIETVWHHDPVTGRITKETGDLGALPGEANYLSNQTFGHPTKNAAADSTPTQTSDNTDPSQPNSFKQTEMQGLDLIKQGFKQEASEIASVFRKHFGHQSNDGQTADSQPADSQANNTQPADGNNSPESNSIDKIKEGFKSGAEDLSSALRELFHRNDNTTDTTAANNDKASSDNGNTDSADDTFLFTAQSQAALYA